MKNQKDNIGALPALLRTAGSVDTLEKNSLCCAAAGIIAPPNATAEALIPHEKLRGATLADATLNAQKRPLAQPVVGEKSIERVLFRVLQLPQIEVSSFQFNISTPLKIIRFLSAMRPAFYKCSFPGGSSRSVQKAHYIQHILTKFEPQKTPRLTCVSGVVFDLTQKLANIDPPLPQLNVVIALDKNIDSIQQKIKFSNEKEYLVRHCKLLSGVLNPSLTFVYSICFTSKKRIVPSLLLAHPPGSNYRGNRPHSLYPSRSTVSRPSPDDKSRQNPDGQSSQRRERNHRNGLRLDRDLSRNHQWLLAITESGSLTKMKPSVYGGAA